LLSIEELSFMMLAAASWASRAQSIGGEISSESESRGAIVRDPVGGAYGIDASFLGRSGEAVLGGTAGAAVCGRMSSSMAGIIGVAARGVFAAISKLVSTAK
jgi:hypothetical protein